MPYKDKARQIGREIREALDRSGPPSPPSDSFPYLLHYPSDSVMRRDSLLRYKGALHKINDAKSP